MSTYTDVLVATETFPVSSFCSLNLFQNVILQWKIIKYSFTQVYHDKFTV